MEIWYSRQFMFFLCPSSNATVKYNKKFGIEYNAVAGNSEER